MRRVKDSCGASMEGVRKVQSARHGQEPSMAKYVYEERRMIVCVVCLLVWNMENGIWG